MAELALLDNLDDETRAELDRLEQGVPDLERQLRAATVALEDEERESATRAVNEPDTEQRERIELRSKAMLTNDLLCAARGRTVDGAEAELQAAARGPLAWEDPLDEDGPASPFWAEAPMLDAEAAPRGVPPLAKVIEEAGYGSRLLA